MTITASLFQFVQFAKASDRLTLPGAILSTGLILGATIIGWKKYTEISNSRTTSASTGSDVIKERNDEARKRAAEAAAQRQVVTRRNPKVNKKKLEYLPPPHSEKVATPFGTPASISPLIDQPTQPDTPIPMPVFDDGITSFRHLPHLPYADSAAATLKQIALEFIPIIRQRGYDVRSISEFCCYGDGLDYQLGGNRFCVGRRCDIAGHSRSEVEGYNLLERTRGIQRVHSIHVRLRSPDNHELLIPHEQVVFTMAHELAHCIHRHHKWQFHALMQELLEQHTCSVQCSSFASLYRGSRIDESAWK
jgi:hypothetical protein